MLSKRVDVEPFKWDWEISRKTSYWNDTFTSIWTYRHFTASLVRREFLLNYQQTILGPFWILFQPLMTLVTYVIVFGKMVKLPTGDLPPVLFYFSGIVLWNFFNEAFGSTSNTFRDNYHIFSKVYFPRIIVPVAALITHFARFCIQLLLLFIIIVYYRVFENTTVYFTSWIMFFPVVVFCTGLIALSFGLIFSVFTAKYRDIGNLVSLGIRLLMFVTPVLYPLVSVSPDLLWIVNLNPLTSLFELFRLSLLGSGSFNINQLLYSIIFMIVTSLVALFIFNKQGDKLIDVV